MAAVLAGCESDEETTDNSGSSGMAGTGSGGNAGTSSGTGGAAGSSASGGSAGTSATGGSGGGTGSGGAAGGGSGGATGGAGGGGSGGAAGAGGGTGGACAPYEPLDGWEAGWTCRRGETGISFECTFELREDNAACLFTCFDAAKGDGFPCPAPASFSHSPEWTSFDCSSPDTWLYHCAR
jgi:hypothetical protein